VQADVRDVDAVVSAATGLRAIIHLAARLATEGRFRSVWCAPGDLARLVISAVRSDVRFATVIAVSPPATSRFDTVNPFGWTPVEKPLGRRGNVRDGVR
jgi:muconolactone delta-isomerase